MLENWAIEIVAVAGLVAEFDCWQSAETDSNCLMPCWLKFFEMNFVSIDWMLDLWCLMIKKETNCSSSCY